MTPSLGLAWRFTALGGLGAGLALAPFAGAAAPPLVLVVLIVAVAVSRPRSAGASPWLCLVAGVSLVAGLTVGAARVAAIDATALELPEGDRVQARGTVVTTPRFSNGTTRFVLEVDGERIGVEHSGPAAIDAGRVVVVRGTVRPPAPWEAGALEREGATRVIAADQARPTGVVRGGLAGALDGIRRRAEAALERGTPERSAALLRGFVLGQDDRISEPIRGEFRRSGLAHVLAVSGQNVMLLALLATPFLALAGLAIRLRLAALMALIAIYVPVAGAGASIQRAGVMGAAGLVAALASRPRARWYALLLAAVVTLAINPRATGDIGWQLSFAAVVGLLALAAPLTQALAGTEAAGPTRRVFAEGGAMTLAATLATAPLAAHHFGAVSLTAIPANLLALPAIAPAMWLGMLAGTLGQVPGAPVEPLSALGGLCAGFIGWVAHVFGGEPAQLEIEEPGAGAAIAITAGLLLAGRLACLALARRSALGPSWRRRVRPRLVGAVGVAAGVALLAALAGAGEPPAHDSGRNAALVVRVLDVGQGDSILLQPRDAAPILVDTGPPGGEAADRLAELGIERLGALAITHDQLDHSGDLADILARVDVERLVFAPGSRPEECGAGVCPRGRPVGAGDAIRSGRLRLDVLWPDADRVDATDDPNARSLVLRARTGRFTALLTGDAEAEAAPIDAGPVDVLKVAHHGSDDSGLAALLERASPQLAVISVGDDNGYGHPAPGTLSALSENGVALARTDTAGEVVIEVRGSRWSVG